MVSNAPLLLIDSGTTNTRIRRVVQGRVVSEDRYRAGARDGTAAIRAVLTEAMKQIDTDDVPYAILSGMITAPTGLMEVPHETGPADLNRWGAKLAWHHFPDIWDKPMALVPGVKFTAGEPWQQDIIRGEETELLGWMQQGKDTFTALHLGSHHKVITVEKGVLMASATALTGEMAAALSEHTLLADSITLPEGIPDKAAALAGLECAMQYGTARTLFLTRVNRMLNGMTEAAAASWFLGALAAEDVRMLQALALPEGALVIYGQQDFGDLVAEAVRRRFPQWMPVVLSAGQSDQLAVAGALALAEQIKEVPLCVR